MPDELKLPKKLQDMLEKRAPNGRRKEDRSEKRAAAKTPVPVERRRRRRRKSDR
jgi:hypothetical protein